MRDDDGGPALGDTGIGSAGVAHWTASATLADDGVVADGAAQRGVGQPAQVVTVDAYPARAGIGEAQYQPDQGRLGRPGGPDDAVEGLDSSSANRSWSPVAGRKEGCIPVR